MFLLSETNVPIEIEAKIIKDLSLTIKLMSSYELEDEVDDVESEKEEIPLPFDNKILEKIIEFCQYYYTKPYKKLNKPLKSNKLEENIDDIWYVNYVDNENEVFLRYLLNAANYLQMDSLIELLCAKFGCLVYGLSFEEINEFLNKE